MKYILSFGLAFLLVNSIIVTIRGKYITKGERIQKLAYNKYNDHDYFDYAGLKTVYPDSLNLKPVSKYDPAYFNFGQKYDHKYKDESRAPAYHQSNSKNRNNDKYIEYTKHNKHKFYRYGQSPYEYKRNYDIPSKHDSYRKQKQLHSVNKYREMSKNQENGYKKISNYPKKYMHQPPPKQVYPQQQKVHVAIQQVYPGTFNNYENKEYFKNKKPVYKADETNNKLGLYQGELGYYEDTGYTYPTYNKQTTYSGKLYSELDPQYTKTNNNSYSSNVDNNYKSDSSYSGSVYTDTNYSESYNSGYSVPGNTNTGYSANTNSDYSGNANTGYSGNTNTGYSGNTNSDYSGNTNTGYSGNTNTGYSGNTNSDYSGNTNTGYSENTYSESTYSGYESSIPAYKEQAYEQSGYESPSSYVYSYPNKKSSYSDSNIYSEVDYPVFDQTAYEFYKEPKYVKPYDTSQGNSKSYYIPMRAIKEKASETIVKSFNSSEEQY